MLYRDHFARTATVEQLREDIRRAHYALDAAKIQPGGCLAERINQLNQRSLVRGRQLRRRKG
jgi:hypothetical protein